MQEVDLHVLSLATLLLLCERVYATQNAQHYERVRSHAIIFAFALILVWIALSGRI